MGRRRQVGPSLKIDLNVDILKCLKLYVPEGSPFSPAFLANCRICEFRDNYLISKDLFSSGSRTCSLLQCCNIAIKVQIILCSTSYPARQMKSIAFTHIMFSETTVTDTRLEEGRVGTL